MDVVVQRAEQNLTNKVNLMTRCYWQHIRVIKKLPHTPPFTHTTHTHTHSLTHTHIHTTRAHAQKTNTHTHNTRTHTHTQALTEVDRFVEVGR